MHFRQAREYLCLPKDVRPKALQSNGGYETGLKKGFSMQDRITIRMTKEMIEEIDIWASTLPHRVSRQEAVRQLVQLALHPGQLAKPQRQE